MKIAPAKILLVLAALAALAFAGCGGGGGETSESTAAATTEAAPSLSREELISQGDAICAEVNAAVGALGSSETEAAVGGEAEKIANLYTGMVSSLQNLGTPEGEEGDYAKFSEAAEELAKVEGEVKLAAEREDTAALEAAEANAGPALEEFQAEAAAFGFEKCSEGPGAVTVTPGTGSESGEEGEAYEEGGVAPEYEEPAPEYEEPAPEYEEPAPETGGAGGGEVAPEGGGGGPGGSESGGVGPG
ncbi:MAG TPA: hypothetical protein VFI17_00450 [Solirubrobacterales bacterium]|nr:hypothetical protein [Solirubrobacterales bacterium]